ncbi:hypothetical protein FGIG_05031 [Fasciola gigantica]|uniref:UspA domain-containing protein n=1 Tax=Fasciola gigantica TaxID=46835 RepID=A0A504Y8Z7_FASGI|nr:hypothetical protein FGIG_05031 [Fasciola gigantica]
MSSCSAVPGEIERRVMIPIDHSVNSRRALDWYLKNLARRNDLVIFVHSADRLETATRASSSKEELSQKLGSLYKASKLTISGGNTLCEDYINAVELENLRAKKVIYVDQHPGKAIVRAAGEFKPHVIVMGNRGVGKIHETFLGSVSVYVLHHTIVPVCIVPPVKS